MVDVFLVSCIAIGDKDTESILLEKALKQRGISSTIVNWEDPTIDWSEAPLSISRTTSSYVFNPEAFFNWAKKVEKTSTLWNTSQTMEWNHHKRYLIELQKKGIPMPETMLFPQNSELSISEIKEMIPWDDFVIKPCLGVGSGGLKRFNKESTELEKHFRELNKVGFHTEYSWGGVDFIPCDTLVQPYLPEITEVGEASLLFYGGEFSHSVIKKVKSGDYRAHPVWGAEVSNYVASDMEIELGYRVLDVSGYPTEFARLDMIPARSGPVLIEVELIDPFMFFDHVPNTENAYANHIQKYLER